MIKTGAELSQKASYIASSVKTLYVHGCFGWPLNQKNKQRVMKNSSFNSKADRGEKIRIASADTFGFDCICLVKALLWGWCGDADKNYGGATYCCNGVKDLDELQMLKVCKEISTDFSNVLPGEYLWTDGHCGIYVGNGMAVECTYRWDDGVQKTAVFNITGEKGKGRCWKKHGKLPYITYDVSEKKKVDYSLNLVNLRRGCKGEFVRGVQLLLNGRGYNCGSTGADGDFGANTEKAVIAYQKANGLSADGIVGNKTMSSLLGVSET